MTAVKSFFAKYVKGESAEETAVMLAVISIFLPFYISAAVLLAVTARSVILHKTRKKMFSGLDSKLLLAFFVLNAITPFLYRNFYGVACFFGICVILIFALYLRSVMTEDLFSRIADTSAFMSICCAAVSTFISDPAHDMRSPAVFFNPNYYGAMITFVIILCTYRLISREGNRFFLIAAILANIYGLLQADCQSAFFAIAFGVWLLLLFKKCWKSSALVTVLALLAVIFLPHLTFIMPRISGAWENIMKRADIWQAGIKAFLETPILGRGMMGYKQIWYAFGGPQNNHCHNLFIDMLLSFGIIGSIPLLWFVIRNLAAVKGKKTAPLILALLASVLLHGMVDITLIWIQTGAFAVVLLSVPFANKEE